MTQPLAGIRVVEFSQFIAAPSAGQRLADLGADVIKVEPPRGDPARPSAGFDGRAMWGAFNRNKRSIALDLRDAADEQTARALALSADVVLHNVTKRSMAKHGLDAESLRETKPELIYASVSGFPSNGPMAEVKGFDGIGQAESGLMAVNGFPDTGPLKLPYAPVDLTTGDLLTQGILAALLQLERFGEGSTLEISLFEAGLHLQETYYYKYLRSGKVPGRIGNNEPEVAPAAEILKVRDGYVIVSAYMEPHWVALTDSFGAPELRDDPRFIDNDTRLANQEALHAIIQGWVAELTVAEAAERFNEIGLANGQVRDYQEVFDGPNLKASGMYTQIPDGAGGHYDALNLPYRFVGKDRPSHRPPPQLDAHGDELRNELSVGASAPFQTGQ